MRGGTTAIGTGEEEATSVEEAAIAVKKINHESKETK
jgi:hypothetical protein